MEGGLLLLIILNDEIIIDADDSRNELIIMNAFNGKVSGGIEDNKIYLKSTALQYQGDFSNVFTGNIELEEFPLLLYFNCTSLAVNAFKDCTNLKIIALPYNCIELKSSCFENTAIESIKSDSLEVIRSYTFKNCIQLKEAILRNLLYLGGDNCFLGNSLLKTVKFHPNLDSISGACFYQCSSLEIDELGDSIKTINQQGFRYCSKLSLTKFPDSLKTIYGRGEFAGTNCNFENLPESVDSIPAILTLVESPSTIYSESSLKNPLYNSKFIVYFPKETPIEDDNIKLQNDGRLILKNNQFCGLKCFNKNSKITLIEGGGGFNRFSFVGMKNLTKLPDNFEEIQLRNNILNPMGYYHNCHELKIRHNIGLSDTKIIFLAEYRGCGGDTFVVTNNITTILLQAFDHYDNRTTKDRPDYLNYLVFDNSGNEPLNIESSSMVCYRQHIKLIDFPERLVDVMSSMLSNNGNVSQGILIFRNSNPQNFSYNIVDPNNNSNSVYNTIYVKSEYVDAMKAKYRYLNILPLEGSSYEFLTIDYDNWTVSYNGVPVEELIP